MSDIPTSFSNTGSVATIVDELDHQADAVLANICILQDKSHKYAAAFDLEARSNHAMVLREDGIALETDLGIIKLNAELITDDRLEAWTNTVASPVERGARIERLATVKEKLQSLELVMSDLRRGMVGDESDFL
ncbi:hypothetical protein EK21DRAFT_80318 [Setomelanomma holmii]|uniref:Uncharacterized protein n=1 Tax=Setomelanomma holmii TaxID=210430 RepID=A0A9P4GXU6_9PLEO|nr:hypothetical protein EK21DRAFT_80318 [Setomelanomma holmii]